MTMRRAKGLEFRAVAIMGIDARHVLLETAVTPKDACRLENQQDIRRERSLLFVSAIRAREARAITWSGRPCQFLPHRAA